MLAGVPTIGCRRGGGGLAGAPFVSNVLEGAGLAASLGPDLVIFDGSGAAIPPIATTARILVAAARRAVRIEGLGPFLVLVRPRAAAHADRASSADASAVFTAGPAATGHLEAEVVHVSHNLARRDLLREELERIDADTYLVELKAAAIDVVAEHALANGRRVVIAGNEVVSDGLDEAVLALLPAGGAGVTDRPLVILIGGATGTGKSTVATEVAYTLGITRLTSTDSIRQTLRAFFSYEFMPAIHHSSFSAGEAIPDADDPLVAGFLEQSRTVLVGVQASIDRALQEGWSIILRGRPPRPGAASNRGGAGHRVPIRPLDRRRDRARAATSRFVTTRPKAYAPLEPVPRRTSARSASSRTLPRRAGGARRRTGDRERERRRGDGRRGRTGAGGGGANAGAGVTDLETEPTVGETADEAVGPCICESYLRSTERAALGAARWLGRDDQEAAEEAAASGMRAALEMMPIRGRVAPWTRTAA